MNDIQNAIRVRCLMILEALKEKDSGDMCKCGHLRALHSDAFGPPRCGPCFDCRCEGFHA